MPSNSTTPGLLRRRLVDGRRGRRRVRGGRAGRVHDLGARAHGARRPAPARPGDVRFRCDQAERIFVQIGALLDGARIEVLPVPFTAVATDLLTRREVWFRDGRARTARVDRSAELHHAGSCGTGGSRRTAACWSRRPSHRRCRRRPTRSSPCPSSVSVGGCRGRRRSGRPVTIGGRRSGRTGCEGARRSSRRSTPYRASLLTATAEERILFVSRGVFERCRGAAGRRRGSVARSVLLGPGVTSPKSRPQGCEAGRAGCRVAPVCPPGPATCRRASRR